MVRSVHVIARYTKIHNDRWKITTNRNPLVTEVPQKEAFTINGGSTNSTDSSVIEKLKMCKSALQ